MRHLPELCDTSMTDIQVCGFSRSHFSSFHFSFRTRTLHLTLTGLWLQLHILLYLISYLSGNVLQLNLEWFTEGEGTLQFAVKSRYFFSFFFCFNCSQTHLQTKEHTNVPIAFIVGIKQGETRDGTAYTNAICLCCLWIGKLDFDFRNPFRSVRFVLMQTDRRTYNERMNTAVAIPRVHSVITSYKFGFFFLLIRCSLVLLILKSVGTTCTSFSTDFAYFSLWFGSFDGHKNRLEISYAQCTAHTHTSHTYSIIYTNHSRFQWSRKQPTAVKESTSV